jgi:hypothetical protein
MRDSVAKLAAANGRSINTEIVAAIEKHLAGVDQLQQMRRELDEHRHLIETVEGKFEELERMVLRHDEAVFPMKYERRR